LFDAWAAAEAHTVMKLAVGSLGAEGGDRIRALAAYFLHMYLV